MTEDANNTDFTDEVMITMVLPSYQWALDRINATDSRIQNMLTFAATVTVAFPLLAERGDCLARYTACPFILAIICFLVLLGLAFWAQTQIGIRLLDPGKLRKVLSEIETDRERRARLIQDAASHYDENRNFVIQKTRLLYGMYAAFLVEFVFLFIWLARC